jgi:hydrogenase-4 component F
MGVLLVLPVVFAAGAAAASVFLRASLTVTVPVRRLAGPVVSLVILASGVALAAAVLSGSEPTAIGGQLRADALSAFMMLVVGAVGVTSTWGGLSDRDPGRAYPTLISLFMAAMTLAVVADNLGVLWIAVELTTIATAFLVGHHRTGLALEAAWKYVVLGSVGVAIAFLGVVLLYAATRGAGTPTLSWSAMHQGIPGLDPKLVGAASGLAILGFATKAGLAPMHSWLPDAHSQAPAPVSGLMSGVLLSVALYAILRIQAIADPVVGPGLARWLLVAAGLLSLTVAALLILRQRDLKRMLAYSSIEHMGLMALAAAVGGTLAISALLLHMLGHGLAKSSTFVVSGRILASEGTTSLSRLRGLLVRSPRLGVFLVAGMTALLGLPPFSIFFTEVAIVVSGFTGGLGWVMAVAVALLLVAFAGLVRNTAAIAFGDPGEREPAEENHDSIAPLVVALGVTAVIAFVGGPFADLIRTSAEALGGVR